MDDDYPTARDDMRRITAWVAVIVCIGALTGFAAVAWMIWRML